MNTFRSTSKNRPSQAIIDLRRIQNEQIAKARFLGQLIATHRMIVEHLHGLALGTCWRAAAGDTFATVVAFENFASVYRTIRHAARLNARAAALNAKAERLERTGAVD